MVNKNYLSLKSVVITVCLLILGLNSQATNNGDIDCGVINGTKFYSNNYPPPNGIAAVNGSCSWVKQGTASCGTSNYGGTNYTLYTYKYICNVPLDGYHYLLLLSVLLVGFQSIRHRKIRSIGNKY